MAQTTKVGDLLKNARLEKKLDFNAISKKTKINKKYLGALEEGEYKVFSSLVHIKGFLKIYASYLGLNEGEILAFWRREYDTYKVSKQERNTPPKPLKDSLLDFSPAFFSTAVIAFLVILFLGYLIYQYTRFSSPPDLLVSQPQEDMVTEIPEVDVFGVASKDARLFINGKEITLGEGGEFLEKVPLSEGMNLINIIAENKFEKQTKKTFKVIYEPTKPPPEPQLQEGAVTEEGNERKSATDLIDEENSL